MEWYAVPTTDQTAVLDAFDLCDPVPATMRMGLAPWRLDDRWRPGDRTAYGEEEPTFEQVYVTPALNGWTLVFANYPTLDGGGAAKDRRARAADALHRCWQLSQRFGTTHWYAYGYNGYEDYSGWCVHEDGLLPRYCFYNPVHFDLPAGDVLVGPNSLDDLKKASPAEDLRVWLVEHSQHAEPLKPFEPHPEAVWAEPPLGWEFSVSRVAGRLSVSPEAFGPDMDVAGTGVLAIPRALRDRPRYGALPV